MAIAELIDGLKASRAESLTRYNELVSELAADESEGIDTAHAGRVLRDSGKTPDQLEADVAKLKRIAVLQGIIDGAGELTKRRIALEAKYAKRFDELRAERQALEAKIVAVESESATEMQRIRIEERKVGFAKQELAQLLHPKKPEPEPSPTFTQAGAVGDDNETVNPITPSTGKPASYQPPGA